uniref:Uncharacterized protein n=1 Tax=Strigamia maritima TaxID=126957 RepID=T1IU57_STRMM
MVSCHDQSELLQTYRFPDDNRTPYKSKRYLVNTPGCRIPDFNPFDPSIVHLYKPVGPLICPGPPSLVIFNRTHMTMDMNTAMKRFHDNIECFYRSIKRKDEKNDNTIHRQKFAARFSTIKSPFTNTVKPPRTGHSADGTPLWSGRYWLDPTRSIPTNRNLPLRTGHLCGQDRGHLVQSRSNLY